MMPWVLVFAADMAAGFTLEPKNLRRNEMVKDDLGLKMKSRYEWSGIVDDDDGWLYVVF